MRMQLLTRRAGEYLGDILIAASFLTTVVILIIGIIDITNFDNQLHYWISQMLGQKDILYFDINFIQTALSITEIVALFLTVYASFYILRKQLDASKRTTILANQPFIVSSESIIFEPHTSAVPRITIKNIGVGPALFVRISFVQKNPDNPENATLKAAEPHSFYLGKEDSYKNIEFDERLFYKFITGTDEGGQLGVDYNKRESKNKLTELIKAKVNDDYYIYLHTSNILETNIVFKIKYSLRINYDDHKGRVEFQLKRMEVKQLEGKIIL